MFAAAKRGRDEKMVQVTKWEDFVPALEKQCLVLTPFCDQKDWEEKVKVLYASSSVFISYLLYSQSRCFL